MSSFHLERDTMRRTVPLTIKLVNYREMNLISYQFCQFEHQKFRPLTRFFFRKKNQKFLLSFSQELNAVNFGVRKLMQISLIPKIFT